MAWVDEDFFISGPFVTKSQEKIQKDKFFQRMNLRGDKITFVTSHLVLID
jgi:hypothetical protein